MSSTRATANPASGNNQTPEQTSSSGQGGGNNNNNNAQQPREVSRWSPSTSSGAPTTAPDSSAATWGSATTNTSSRPATVEENRAQALDILQGGARGPSDGRVAENLTERITEDPVSAGQASSSGQEAKRRRA